MLLFEPAQPGSSGGRYPPEAGQAFRYIFFAKKKQKSPPEHFRAGMPLQSLTRARPKSVRYQNV